ncbi:hypothetical protein [Campylobacter helveticus]|uniref:hypothetical protein n=1 Tax=Campylobacter helveticus TaxID=28898 RepID=UPI00214A4FA4|nr:hypothetical protein [Campylobacter helveticus]MCR2067194.1 hypothetical protein [Campylobacter helveticus]
MKLKLCDEIFTIKKLDKQVAFNKTIFCLINEYDGPSVIETISKNSTASLKFRAFYIDELDDFSQSGILFQVLKLLKKIISAFQLCWLLAGITFSCKKQILKRHDSYLEFSDDATI